ncbi:acetyl-CoA hydrolase/transferase C-terminal domain-containing protein [Mycobacterium sp. URHB0044]|uniref:acetyl-CoA hydrolase/transferase C-terminal domain-containing protein n=1 Tax=Mycobacterium sp. URHB0044 TaxID=1380386 RepID=UPI0009DF50C4|nr:acetyl-CoA hydrolase/transferase C-terminal domain-containing protein [Mycobacterium sp. URHB0044]
MTVALGDGVGAVRCLQDGTAVGAVLSAAARDVGGIRLLLGWLPIPLVGLEVDAFAEVVALMPGWGVRDVLRQPNARFVPTRLTGFTALLAGPLRPDLLLTRLGRRGGDLFFTTEVSWQRAVIDGGVPTMAIVDECAPIACDRPVESAAVTVVGSATDGPVELPVKEPAPVHEALADEVLRWIPAGARLQYGPGQLGTALLRRTAVPLQLDTGLLTDAALDLDRRKLLIGTPTATYLLGSDALHRWADGRGVLHGIEFTHDLTRITRGDPLITVNTAIELDRFGQVNVEGRGDKVIGGIGGHADYCLAGHVSTTGLSIIAIASAVDGCSALVDQLSRPVSTAAHDVDVVVTEAGSADLRGASWAQREALITKLFNA